nr:hypothetical protein [Steroidobacteraceae bacterium]
ARKWMHTVIASECTGCELCIPPCPVDCIVMEPDPARPARLPTGDEIGTAAAGFRRRYEARLARRARDEAERRAALAAVARPA